MIDIFLQRELDRQKKETSKNSVYDKTGKELSKSKKVPIVLEKLPYINADHKRAAQNANDTRRKRPYLKGTERLLLKTRRTSEGSQTKQDKQIQVIRRST
jgi:hypothetical protein